jgi:hypothetical protein
MTIFRYEYTSTEGIDPTPKVRGDYGKEKQLNNRPLNIIHNHERGGVIQYMGFSSKSPAHHLFKCFAFSEPPRKPVVLKDFDRRCFTRESKAGQGGCSNRNCPGEAEFMNPEATQAYCALCAQRVRGIIPCSWTSIILCNKRWGNDRPPYGKPCPTCRAFERKAS